MEDKENNQGDLAVRGLKLPELALKLTNHNPAYLIQIMQDYKITPEELDVLATYIKDHETHLPKLLSLIDRKYSLSEIEQLLEARDVLIKREKMERKGKSVNVLKQQISIECLVRLHESFPEIDFNADSLYNAVNEISEILPKHYIGSSVDAFISLSKKLGGGTLETTIERINAVEEFFSKYRENPNYFDAEQFDDK